jgi:ABC-type nitrate/sulfonate/bicarbonate transport system permease component
MTARPGQLTEAGVRTFSLLGTLLVWQAVAMLVDRPLLPTPAVVLASMWRYLVAGDLLYHLGITLARVAASFVLALGIGTACGILMGRYRWVDAGLDGLLILGLNLPALVLAILCYIWFGLGEAAAVTAVALNKIPTVVVSVREGARAVDRGLLDVAHVFRVPRGRTFWRVYVPQLYPYLMAAVRSGLALVWKIVLVVELLGRSNGIGFQLGTYFQFFDITSILAYTLAFAGTVMLVEGAGIRPVERHLTRWRG